MQLCVSPQHLVLMEATITVRLIAVFAQQVLTLDTALTTAKKTITAAIS